MQLFINLFSRHLQWVYLCFDRIVVNGYLSFLTREANVVYFFRQICGIPKITKEVLRARTTVYRNWVESFAANQQIPIEWAPKQKHRKEEIVERWLKRQERCHRFGVYYIMRSMEQGPSFRIFAPKFPTNDPDHQIVRKQRSRYTHYYFYILDEIAGPMVLRIGTFLPFPVTAILNGHNFIERELIRRHVAFEKNDNRFMSVGDSKLFGRLAAALNGKSIQRRVDHWTYILGPKFSKAQRAAVNLHRLYAVSQIEFCHNFIFKRDWPIKSIFERSCELGLYLLSADRITNIFGHQVRRRISGKLQSVVERLDKGQFVLRSYFGSSFLKQYQKCARFLRGEIVCNNLKQFRLRKSLCHFGEIRKRFAQILDRFAQTQAQLLNVHGQFNILARMAKPVIQGNTKVAGIKLENVRLMRLMEVLMQGACDEFHRWRADALRRAVIDQFNLGADRYTLNQVRYDLRKLRLHGIIKRLPHSYCYGFTTKGLKIALLFTQLRKRIYGPIAYSLFRARPDAQHSPDSTFERAYNKLDNDFNKLITLLAA